MDVVDVDRFHTLFIGGAVAKLLADAWASSVEDVQLRYVVELNLIGTILVSQAASVPMKQQKSGTIVNVASVMGLGNVGHQGEGGGLCSCEGGHNPLHSPPSSRAGPIRHSCKLHRSRYYYIVQIRGTGPAADGLDEKFPLIRLGTPEDCANVIEFFVSDLSGYVTGDCIVVAAVLGLLWRPASRSEIE